MMIDNAKQITITDGQPPHFVGQWTVGEVLQMAESLAQWARLLTVNVPPTQEPIKDDNNAEL